MANIATPKLESNAKYTLSVATPTKDLNDSAIKARSKDRDD